MFHTYAAKFDVMGNLKNFAIFLELNKALVCILGCFSQINK